MNRGRFQPKGEREEKIETEWRKEKGPDYSGPFSRNRERIFF
jgi:hypothetical protein